MWTNDCWAHSYNFEPLSKNLLFGEFTFGIHSLLCCSFWLTIMGCWCRWRSVIQGEMHNLIKNKNYANIPAQKKHFLTAGVGACNMRMVKYVQGNSIKFGNMKFFYALVIFYLHFYSLFSHIILVLSLVLD